MASIFIHFKGGNMIKRVSVLLMAVILCWSVQAFAVEVDSIEIVDYGITESVDIKTVETGDIVAGSHTEKKGFKVIETTTRIPAKKGIQFGFKCRLKAFPKGKNVTLLYNIIHPPLKNPRTGKEGTIDKFSVKYKIGTTKCFSGYEFDEKWEAVPGDWILQIWYEGRKLSEKTFTVYKP